MKTIVTLVLLAWPVWAARPQSIPGRNHQWKVGQTVQTSSGPVTGGPGTVVPAVSSYLGIPFAKAPIGVLRFAPPQEYNGASAINATQFSPSCPIGMNWNFTAAPNNTNANLTTMGEYIPAAILQLGDIFSEDCLTLNVWTKPQMGGSRKAVLVWLYGGGFTSGSSNNPGTNGEHFVDEEDVVVVSFNYRMNIFGFPGNPHIQNNLGFLDQRLAIEWIHRNIAAFGGDPSRITLFGESAGAGSIDFYSYAWIQDPLVAGLIMESGTTGLGAFGKNFSAESWYNVTSALNCGDAASDPAAVINCMRSKNFTDIIAAIPIAGGPLGSALFWPTVDNELVFSDYPARSAAKKFTQVPILVGNNDYEGGFYATVAAIFGEPQPRSFWEGYSDTTFNCPAAARANASVEAGLPVWRYRYFGDFPDLRLTTVPDSGAYHSAELSVLFGNFPPVIEGIPPTTDQEVAVGRYLRSAWATFAEDPVNGLRKCGWPTYEPGKEALVRLGYDNDIGTHLASSSLYDASC